MNLYGRVSSSGLMKVSSMRTADGRLLRWASEPARLSHRVYSRLLES